MQRVSRYALAALAALLLIGVVGQAFLAGIALFGAGPMQLHIDVGWALHLVPVLILLLLWPARASRSMVELSLVLFVLVGIQPFLPMLRDSLALVAALHPVNALAIFWASLLLTRRSWMLARRQVPRGLPESSLQEVSAR
jgi:hypothetical protein